MDSILPQPHFHRVFADSASDTCSANSESDDEYTLPCLPDDWSDALPSSKSTLPQISEFLRTECENHTIFPPLPKIWTAFELCPPENVKVVIQGQDPYHGVGQANGLSFSVDRGTKIPPPLRNILKEVVQDTGNAVIAHGDLRCWARQGVLMLNAVLTVRSGEPNSHKNKGWEKFTDEVIELLNKKEGIVFLMWGDPAQKKASRISETRHTIIRSSHPSPLGCRQTSTPFMGSKCFSRVNEVLVSAGKTPIAWTLC
jgi:uracil-DNA glycosylase